MFVEGTRLQESTPHRHEESFPQQHPSGAHGAPAALPPPDPDVLLCDPDVLVSVSICNTVTCAVGRGADVLVRKQAFMIRDTHAVDT